MRVSACARLTSNVHSYYCAFLSFLFACASSGSACGAVIEGPLPVGRDVEDRPNALKAPSFDGAPGEVLRTHLKDIGAA